MNYYFVHIVSISPENTMEQLDISMYLLFFVCDIMKCSLDATAISNLDDSCYQQYSCHLCTMSTFTTFQECD